MAPGQFAYDAAGVHGALATVLALWQRLRTGRGQHLDVSVQESVSGFADWSLPSFSITGQTGHRTGAGIYSLYPCADGHVRGIILVKHHWHALRDWRCATGWEIRPSSTIPCSKRSSAGS